MKLNGGYTAVALWHPKNAVNYGTALRSCVAFDADLIEIIGPRFQRQSSDVSKSWKKIPLLVLPELVIPYDCVPIGVELADEAVPLPTFSHPRRALYIFGAEDGGLPTAVQKRCRDVVQIPGRLCLNLASAVTVVLYDRAAKNVWRTQ